MDLQACRSAGLGYSGVEIFLVSTLFYLVSGRLRRATTPGDLKTTIRDRFMYLDANTEFCHLRGKMMGLAELD